MPNSEAIERAICQAVTETLENMAFIELYQEEAGEIKAIRSKLDRQMRLQVISPLVGELVVLISEPLLEEIASNIYAVDAAELSLEMKTDALAELLNTIAGVAMAQLTEPNEFIELGLPEKVDVDYGLEVEGQPVCMLSWEDQYVVFCYTNRGLG